MTALAKAAQAALDYIGRTQTIRDPGGDGKEWAALQHNLTVEIAMAEKPGIWRKCECGFVGLRHTPTCPVYPLTVEGGAAGYPPGGGDDDSDLD